ncbi:class I SAM-dependent DNA methyltransferase [Nitrospira defluvii]|uniref:site-specific DNA-methyltransferase (adenine-specific) n=1 Tax=Nitrospira defluvii TaxID=330214 RepID=A0ABM8R8K1_9BACT|nr:class I SAM-dependent DNA methyltransferase [Nitrospira defluvii]CAE6739154.1 Site-specific DNA-methyltransferase (adenine-specific) [Nitrospira defluvii]
MQWIAPSEKDTATDALEKRLWDAADQLRANSGLNAAQYSTPVLGLIFLRFADVRFAKIRSGLEKMASSSRRGSRVDEPAAYHAEGVLYLTPNARFEKLLHLPEGSNAGKAINEAMREIEKHNPQLAGVLPKTYEIFNSTLLKELLKRVSEIPATIDYDAFGRIYEYFLGEFARTEGQKGGEFYTPSGIVRLLVEVLEPYHGRILDPACGSGGMFVQSGRFVAEHKKNPSSELAIHGQEKVAATVALCRMNLAMHGLEGDIKEAITYYDDLHNSTGRFDFVLANPPFNVNAVDKERLEAEVGKGRRYPFGLPRTDNANYLWIQLFYSTLSANGRAGFVMANSASDARSSEQDIRKQLIEARAVDVMVAVGPNMFYTVTLPCTLWFFDKGKQQTPRMDKVLFLDARHIYRQVDRAHRDWTEGQIGFLANVVRLYRSEEPDFTLGGPDAEAKLKEVFGKKLKFSDVPGLCKAATIKEIEAQGWSLNPGRYVGVAPGEAVSDEDFKEQLETLNEELETLNAQARELEQIIARNVAEILEL